MLYRYHQDRAIQKDFEYVRLQGARLTLMPRKGSAALGLVVQAGHQKEVLPLFQRFLSVHSETPAPFAAQPIILWLRHRFAALVLTSLLLFTAVLVLSSCGEGPDTSGLQTANQSNLTSVSANGTSLTQKDLDAAKSKEPFAYNLALLVDENRLATNFVWTLVTGYLVMFMQAGFALVETGLCRAKNAGRRQNWLAWIFQRWAHSATHLMRSPIALLFLH